MNYLQRTLHYFSSLNQENFALLRLLTRLCIYVCLGLAFIHANTEKLLEEQNGSFLEWFAIVFPAMIELAETKGLHVYFSNGSTALVEQVFLERQQIFKTQR